MIQHSLKKKKLILTFYFTSMWYKNNKILSRLPRHIFITTLYTIWFTQLFFFVCYHSRATPQCVILFKWLKLIFSNEHKHRWRSRFFFALNFFVFPTFHWPSSRIWTIKVKMFLWAHTKWERVKEYDPNQSQMNVSHFPIPYELTRFLNTAFSIKINNVFYLNEKCFQHFMSFIVQVKTELCGQNRIVCHFGDSVTFVQWECSNWYFSN